MKCSLLFFVALIAAAGCGTASAQVQCSVLVPGCTAYEGPSLVITNANVGLLLTVESITVVDPVPGEPAVLFMGDFSGLVIGSPVLVSVNGSLVFDDIPSSVSINFPLLRNITGRLRFERVETGSLLFPSLESVFDVEDFAAAGGIAGNFVFLASSLNVIGGVVDFSSLVDVGLNGGDLISFFGVTVTGNPAMLQNRIFFPVLNPSPAGIVDFSFINADSVEAPLLQSATDLILLGSFTSIDFTNLASVTQQLTLGRTTDLVVAGFPSLTSAEALFIATNLELQDLRFEALIDLVRLTLVDNDKLVDVDFVRLNPTAPMNIVVSNNAELRIVGVCTNIPLGNTVALLPSPKMCCAEANRLRALAGQTARFDDCDDTCSSIHGCGGDNCMVSTDNQTPLPPPILDVGSSNIENALLRLRINSTREFGTVMVRWQGASSNQCDLEVRGQGALHTIDRRSSPVSSRWVISGSDVDDDCLVQYDSQIALGDLEQCGFTTQSFPDLGFDFMNGTAEVCTMRRVVIVSPGRNTPIFQQMICTFIQVAIRLPRREVLTLNPIIHIYGPRQFDFRPRVQAFTNFPTTFDVFVVWVTSVQWPYKLVLADNPEIPLWDGFNRPVTVGDDSMAARELDPTNVTSINLDQDHVDNILWPFPIQCEKKFDVCEQLFQWTIFTNMSRCHLKTHAELNFTVECQPTFNGSCFFLDPNSPPDERLGALPSIGRVEVGVEFDVDAGFFCPTVVDTVDIEPSFTIHLNKTFHLVRERLCLQPRPTIRNTATQFVFGETLTGLLRIERAGVFEIEATNVTRVVLNCTTESRTIFNGTHALAGSNFEIVPFDDCDDPLSIFTFSINNATVKLFDGDINARSQPVMCEISLSFDIQYPSSGRLTAAPSRYSLQGRHAYRHPEAEELVLADDGQPDAWSLFDDSADIRALAGARSVSAGIFAIQPPTVDVGGGGDANPGSPPAVQESNGGLLGNPVVVALIGALAVGVVVVGILAVVIRRQRRQRRAAGSKQKYHAGAMVGSSSGFPTLDLEDTSVSDADTDAPIPKTSDASLPNGWRLFTCDGVSYYFNEATGERSFTRPSAF